MLYFLTMIKSTYVKHFDYFFRQSQQENCKSDLYRLVGIAKQDTRFLQIYQHYFSEIYSQQYFKQMNKIARLQRKHFSIFFLAFLNISILKNSICSYYSITEAVKETISDIVRPESDAMLVNFIKEIVNQAFEHQYRTFLNFHTGKSSEVPTQQYIQSAIKASAEIVTIVENVVKEITNHFQSLKEYEIIPSAYNSKQFIKHIRQNFSKIINLHIPRNGLKARVLSEFNKVNIYHFALQFVNKDQRSNLENQKCNSFTLPKYSQQADQILTKMIDFLPRPCLTLQAIKLIMDFCFKYHRITQSSYPITFTDLYLDQKSLKTVVSQTSFIKDAIGIKGNIKNTQLRISTEPTPNAIILQECHLQLQELNRWLLLRKYYHPRANVFGLSIDEQRQRLRVIDPKQPQMRELQKTLSENIHVWKIICIMYFIMHRQHFNNVLYNKYYNQITNTQSIKKENPFFHQHYKQVLEYAYLQITKGYIKIADLLMKDDTNKEPSQLDESVNQFNFTLSSLRRQLQIQDEDEDDSMIQDLRMHQIKSQIYERNLLLEEIQAILFNRKLFKRMTNVVKYILVLYSSLHEQIYFKRLIKSKSQAYGKAQSQIISMLQGGINGVNLLQQLQRKRSRFKSIQEKIDSYQSRNDSNGEYFKIKPNKYQEIISIIKQHEQIIGQQIQYDLITVGPGRESQKIEQLRILLSERFQQHMENRRSYEQNKTIFRQIITKKLIELKEKLQSTLKQHFQSEIEKVINTPNTLHKVSDFKNEEICLYFNYKLSNTIKLYLSLDEQSWKSIYMKTQTNIHQVQPQKMDLLTRTQINLMINRQKFIGKTIQDSAKR